MKAHTLWERKDNMKQFILDRHTTPGTPVMDQVPTEKIPVYDTDADVDADLANLEVGQIVATKDLGLSPNDWKQYISDENELSDYETPTLPYSTSSSTVPADVFTAEYDGFVTFSFQFGSGTAGSAPYAYLFLSQDNGATYIKHYVAVNDNASRLGAAITLPIRQGDKCYVYASGSNFSGESYFFGVQYYKKRHYEFR